MSTTKSNRVPFDDVESLADGIGEFIEYWGFKKIHGRTWTYIFLSKDGLTPAQLMEKLRVSKGLLSIAINELEDYQLIFAAGKVKNGRVVYRANRDVLSVILEVLRNRERKMLAQIGASLQLMKQSQRSRPAPDVDKENLAYLEKLTASARNSLDFLIFTGERSPAVFERIRKII